MTFTHLPAALPSDPGTPAAGPDLAVVSGATGSLGSQLCRSLTGQGLSVVAVARDRDRLADLAEAVPGVIACPADISTADVTDRLAAAVQGPVRLVVHAVGLPASGPTATIDPQALGEAVSVKAGGLLRVLRAVEPRLQPGSRIVAVGGHFGNEPSTTTCAAGVANAALANLVRQLADLYGPRGITVHLVAPGPLDSARLHRIASATAERRGVDVETVLAEYRRKSPLGRLVTVEQVDWMIRTLLAPEADALHGATLSLDAGSRRGIF